MPYMYGWCDTSGQVMTCARFTMGSMVVNSGYGHKFGALDVEHEAPSTEHFNQTEAGCGTGNVVFRQRPQTNGPRRFPQLFGALRCVFDMLPFQMNCEHTIPRT